MFFFRLTAGKNIEEVRVRAKTLQQEERSYKLWYHLYFSLYFGSAPVLFS